MVKFNMHILRVVSKGFVSKRPDTERPTLFCRLHLCWKLKQSWFLKWKLTFIKSK